MDEWDVRRLKAVQRKGRQEHVGLGDVLSKEQKLLNKKDETAWFGICEEVAESV